MSRPEHEVADIIRRFGESFIINHQPNPYQLRVLRSLSMCRTSSLGGHKYRCDHCGSEHISYNSCRNRHCPKCQSAKQAFWVEDRIRKAYPVRHYHIIFTVPEVLNEICLIDSKCSIINCSKPFGMFYARLVTVITEWRAEPYAFCIPGVKT